MRLNNKGFAMSSVIYMALVLFLVLIMSLLTVLASRKNILDKNRKDTYNYVNNVVDNSEKQSDLNMDIPSLSGNMIPIVYNPSGLPLKADTNLDSKGVPRNWYNYVNKKWANAVLVKESVRATYVNALPGEEIKEDDILAYLVWVPRYKYSVNAADKSINVVFEKKSTTKSNGTATNTSYLTHPAFTFNGNELSGMWVAKYVASNSDTLGSDILIFKAGQEPLLTLYPEEMIYNARQMEIINNIYGFTQTSSANPTMTGIINGDSNSVDTHALKNIEWGAITLLSQSKYGKGTDVESYNTNTYISGGGDIYKVISNVKQSTTGNIYGIYDMVSTKLDSDIDFYGELVMAATIDIGGLDYLDYYFDYYGESATSGIKGDATNNDNLNISSDSVFPGSSNFIVRGKNSIYTFYGFDGSDDYNLGFRISLAIW